MPCVPSSKPARRFQDIVENIDRIFDYVEHLDRDRFLAEQRTIDACERCLMRISEAASKLGDYAEAVAPDQPWREIRDYGNFARHEYDNVTPADTWSIIQHNLPDLHADSLKALELIEQQEQEQQQSAPPAGQEPEQGH
jgi:uncharacterized protein with HEPN domain